ncbi:MAG: amino acid adenylation domain-containing protein [Pseudomonadales bacterium]|nr:amino acid adenylation domain-containing protein [Pseudomonadales bacterium]
MYLVNEDKQLLPQGLIGELCISGEGVGQGYLNRNELNKHAFEINPYANTETLYAENLQRWYRSGDLMRYLPDGNLEFISRKDFQVKVRGLRIEPGEIEWALNQSSVVDASLVLAHEDKLLAFVLISANNEQQNIKDWDWRSHLRRYLPDSMLPSLLRPIDQWPLTPNGKVDRKALIKLRGDETQKIVPPRNPVEEALCEIWAQVLGLEEVGIEDNFFEIGGHSLLATRIISRCRLRFQVEVPLRELFESPTIATLAVLVDQSKNKLSAPPIEAAPAGADIPLSFAQQRLWFIDQLNPGNIAYLMPGAFKIHGSLNLDKFVTALKQVVNRHEILRTHIINRDGQAWQKVYPADDWQPSVKDLSGEKEQQAAIASLIKTNSSTALNLEKDALFNITLAKLSATETVLISTMHHIIGDGWSFGILLRELAFYYGVDNTDPKQKTLPTLAVQYADYSLWQRDWMQGDVLESHIQFWKKHLHGVPAVLNLPFDKPRPKVQSFEGSNYSFTIDKSLSDKLKNIAQEQQVTLFMLLLGAYKIQLSRYSGQKDICVGLPVAGRDHAPTEQLMGLFLNAIVVRTRFEGNASLTEYYQQLKSSLLACLSHQDLPAEILLEKLNIERNLSHAPVAQVGFQLQNFDEAGSLPEFAGLELENLPLARVSSKYDMTFILREGEDGLAGVVEYSTSLFHESSIAKFVQHYVMLLENISAYFEQGIDDVSLVNAKQLASEIKGADTACDILPLSHMQKDLVLLSRVTPDTLDNCFGGALIFPEKTDANLLYKAMNNVAKQSSILRSRIGLSTLPYLDDAYRLVFNELQAEWENVSRTPFEDETQADAYVRKLVFRPYDLSQKLLRFQLLKTENNDYLIIAAHHALLDGMGVASMVASVLEVYYGLLDQKETTLPEEYFPQYLNKERQQTDTPQAIHYWREKLCNTAGLSQWRGHLALDNATPPAERAKPSITRCIEKLDADHWQAIRKYCRTQRITPALYFKGLFGLLVQLYCRPEEDFSLYELSADLLGMKLNAAGCTVQRRPFVFGLASMQAEQDITDYFKHLREEQRGIDKSGFHTSIMMQKQIVPQSRLSFMYNYYHFTREFEVAGHSYDTLLFHNDVEQVHLVVNFKQGQLSLGLHYPRNEFDDLQLLERLAFISQQVVAVNTESIVNKISDIDFTLSGEKRFIKQQLSGEQKPLNTLVPINQQFELSQQSYLNNVAVQLGDKKLLYGELQHLSNKLAHELLTLGIDQNSRVAICLARSPELLVALLAVMKTGASYVPIDISYPRDRIAYILNDSDAALLISSSRLQQRLPSAFAQTYFIENLDESTSSAENLNIATNLNDIFYVIYTSGSTGQPKGAAVKQQGVCNLLDWYRDEFQFDSTTRHLVISAFGFDLTQKNLWAPLLSGGSIHFPQEEHYHPKSLLTQIQAENINVINCAPSAFYGIVEACEGNYQKLQSLRWVILGGEAIILDRLRQWLHSEYCQATLVNNYGPTECTDIAAFYCLENLQRKTVPIGQPNTNVNLHLVNEHGQPVPPGVVGELCISGAGVGAGYLNKPELSEKVFQTMPENNLGEQQWYRSGDLMCLLPNGDLEFVGRKDFQIKLRGLRIELQEVEGALLAQNGVEDCLVQIDRRPLQDNEENTEELERLVAYVIGPDSLNETHWFTCLSETLPAYMIPSNVIVLSQWPLTPNGKVDRQALPKIEELDSTPFIAPRSEIEESLAQIWCEVLGLNKVGIWDNFFQVGGNSLLAVRIVARMEKTYAAHFPLSMLFAAQNIAELAQLVSRQVNPESWSPLVLIKEARLAEGEIPLPPLYLIHPVGGTILCYHALAEALQKREPKRPIFGLQCSGLSPDQPTFNRFEIMATYYIEAILAQQPHGPYYLAGQSLGGNIAWEIAQQLRAQNHHVAFVGLIDTFVPENIPQHYREQNTVSLLRSQMGGILQLDWSALEKLDLKEQITHFYNAAQTQGIISAELTLEHVQRIAHVMKANAEALLAYKAQACAVPVMHVRATENNNGDSSIGWPTRASVEYSAAKITASHDGILQGKAAEQLADLIQQATRDKG